MSRFQLLSDAQWELIEDLLPVRTGKKGRPFRDARQLVEGITYRYRCGIAWRWRGLATRYDKLAIVYRGAAILRAITLWLPY